MSYKGDHKIDGYFEYVVPPLEGFWWQDGVDGIKYDHKENFNFISLISEESIMRFTNADIAGQLMDTVL